MKEIFLQFELFGNNITLRWFQIMAALGFLAALHLYKKRAINYREDPERMEMALFYSMMGAIVGARLLFVVRNWEEKFAMRSFWKVFDFSEGGLVFQGGFFGGLLTAFIICRAKKIDFLKALDIAMPCLALAHAFGRVGCFLNGCCHGGRCEVNWLAVQYPQNSFVWQDHLQKNYIDPSASLSAPVHAAQLYATVALVLLCIALCKLSKKFNRSGIIFALYLVIYSAWRFSVEFLRDDQNLTAGLSLAQYIAIGTFLVGVGLVYGFKNNKRHTFLELNKAEKNKPQQNKEQTHGNS